MGQLLCFEVAKIVELNPNAIPGGRPQIVRLRVVEFEVDGSVCFSCDFFERVGIVCIYILAIVHNLDASMADFRWRAVLGFYFGKTMYAKFTSVIMQALESYLKKGQRLHTTTGDMVSCVQGWSEGICFSSLFQERCRTAFSHQVQVSTSSVYSDGM
jgi:hypothetical protein